MDLSHFRILINGLFKNYSDIVPEEAPLIVLDGKSDMWMAKNSKDTKHTIHIARRMHFVRNVEKCRMHKIDWCEVGLLLTDISTKNCFEPDLITGMKYIMVMLDN